MSRRTVALARKRRTTAPRGTSRVMLSFGRGNICVFRRTAKEKKDDCPEGHEQGHALFWKGEYLRFPAYCKGKEGRLPRGARAGSCSLLEGGRFAFSGVLQRNLNNIGSASPGCNRMRSHLTHNLRIFSGMGSNRKVALVHDWLVGMRGGEKVLELLCELFPDATLFTLVHRPGTVSPAIERLPIRTSYIQRLPFGLRHYRYFLPLFPSASRGLDARGFDVVISSSHAAAKGVRVGPGAIHKIGRASC